jgi:hypothetical protein
VSRLSSTPWGIGVRVVPDSITIPATVGLGMLGASTVRADSAPCGYVGIPAIAGAILGRAIQFARVERLAAAGARIGAAGVAYLRAWRPGPELCAALLAHLGLSDDGQAAIPHQVGMLTVKGLFGYAVADIAECDQVVQAVGLLVGLEQVKRFLVVDREIVNRTAMLAGVAVSLKRLFSLTVPVCAAIVKVSTLPAWAFWSSKAPFAPSRVAIPRAKAMCPVDVVRFSLELSPALVTHQSNHT